MMAAGDLLPACSSVALVYVIEVTSDVLSG
jgi:hypothetical protein